MSFIPSVFATLSDITKVIHPTVGLFAGTQEAQAVAAEAEIEATEQEFAAGAELFNADIARQEARLAQARVKIEIGRRRKARERLISEQQVLYAKSGVRIDVGTPLIVMQDTLEETELDILILQFNADVKSQRLESEARQAELKAEQRREVARQKRVAGRIRAGKTLLESVSTFAQKFPTSRPSGMWPFTPKPFGERGVYRLGVGAKAPSGGISAITGKGYGLAG